MCVEFSKLAIVGVTIVGLLDNTTFPVPVFVVTPVPPCATATVVPSQVPVPIVPTDVIFV